MSLYVFKCTKIYLDENCQAVKGEGCEGWFYNFFHFYFGFEVSVPKRWDISVKTFKRFGQNT